MKTIEYRITYSDGNEEVTTITARNINSGFTYALGCARRALSNGKRREISRIEFWRVTS